ncbi:NACHT domain- and WD repeat-containing protein 1-like isoform x3, partial [Biomphalaria glabrata]
YVVAKSINNGPISVWNVAKGKCLQSEVRIERVLFAKGKCLQSAVRIELGLAEGTDAMVIRNTTLVILTDKGYSPVTQDQRPVFQTVLVYDLKLKKYVRKLTGCYIVPAPSHEYVLLDNDCLLGPSESRSHFVIWNLLTGHEVTRIKT